MDRWKFVNEKWIPRPVSRGGRGTTSAVDRVLSYIACLRRSFPLFFIPPLPYPARSARHLLLAGKALCRGYRFPPSNLRPFGAPPSIGRRECPHESLPLEGAAERSEAGLASFLAAKPPPLCLPHRGRGTAPAVDRVLSLMAHLRRSFPLVFHAASPSNLRPFGAPPSIGRREYPREPLPLEGADERSEAGLASFLGGKAASSLPSPLGKGGPRQRRSGAFVNGVLETISPHSLSCR